MSWTVVVLAVAVLTPAVRSQGMPPGGPWTPQNWSWALQKWLQKMADQPQTSAPKPSSEYRLWIDGLVPGVWGPAKPPNAETNDRICVYGTGKESGRELSECSNGLEPRDGVDNAKSPWISLGSMRLDRDIIIETTGEDVAWIDRFEIYERITHSDGDVELKTIRAYGRDNFDGWCLSRDLYDYIGFAQWFIGVPAKRCYPKLVLKPNGDVTDGVPAPAPGPTHHWERTGFGDGINGLGRRLQRAEAETPHLVVRSEKNSS